MSGASDALVETLLLPLSGFRLQRRPKIAWGVGLARYAWQ